MKKIIILSVLLSITFSSFSQVLDKIYLKNKDVISGKILNVTSNNIEINPEGSKPFLMIKRNDVKLIIYSDNTIVNFEDSDLKKIESKKINLQSINKEKSLFPLTEEDIYKSIIDTLKNYEKFYNDLSYNSDLLGLGSSPFYYKDSEILKFKIKNIKTEYERIWIMPKPLNYKDIWEYSKSGKLISKTTYRESIKEYQSNYKWDSDGKIISSTNYNSGGLFDLNRSLITTLYSYKGDTIIIRKKDENSKLKEISIRLKNINISMDTEDERIQINILQRQYTGYKLLTYSYDKNKTFNKYISKYIFNNDKISEFYSESIPRKEFFYNKSGHLLKYYIYVGKNKIEFKMFYDKKGLVKKTSLSKHVRNYSYEFY